MLLYSGLCVLENLSLPILTFAQPTSKLSMQALHKQVAQQAKQLAFGRNIDLTILFPKGALGNLKPIGKLFTQMTGIEIKYSEVPYEQINTHIILSAMAQNAEFDLSLPATFALPDLIESSALEKLDRFAAKYEPEYFRNNILYSMGDYYKRHFYGYQTDGDTYLMFYNKAWLQDVTEKRKFEKKVWPSPENPKNMART